MLRTKMSGELADNYMAGNKKERRNARRRPFLRGENLFLLEQEAGREHGDGAKKPFNTP
jgi:hypothetical protein